MPPPPLSLGALRAHAVARSLFTPTTLTRAIEKLGFVQADPIRAPARAQDLILRPRVKGYRAGDLERRYPALGIEEDYFINYGFLPTAQRALMHPRVPRTPLSAAAKRHAQALVDFVRERGVVHPREATQRFARGSVKNYWGGSSSATTHLLDALHYRGLLRVARRENGTRLYAVARGSAGAEAGPARSHAGSARGGDGPLRAVDSAARGGDGPLRAGAGAARTFDEPARAVGHAAKGGEAAAERHPARRRSGDEALGVEQGLAPREALDRLVDLVVGAYAPLPAASLGPLVRRLRYAVPQWAGEMNGALQRAKQRLARARVDGADWYWPAGERVISRRGAPGDGVRLLAPFDPLVWDRRRFEIFWGWAYRFEAYTPAHRRKLGYYALPLLWRDEVIGWGNLSFAQGALTADLGFVAGHRPRGPAFERELDAERERLEAFLDIAAGRARLGLVERTAR